MVKRSNSPSTDEMQAFVNTWLERRNGHRISEEARYPEVMEEFGFLLASMSHTETMKSSLPLYGEVIVALMAIHEDNGPKVQDQIMEWALSEKIDVFEYFVMVALMLMTIRTLQYFELRGVDDLYESVEKMESMFENAFGKKDPADTNPMFNDSAWGDFPQGKRVD